MVANNSPSSLCESEVSVQIDVIYILLSVLLAELESLLPLPNIVIAHPQIIAYIKCPFSRGSECTTMHVSPSSWNFWEYPITHVVNNGFYPIFFIGFSSGEDMIKLIFNIFFLIWRWHYPFLRNSYLRLIWKG